MVNGTLSRMHLLGFRSTSAQDVDFDNPTFFVGRNGSGKSNFADAFAFLSEAMVSPLEGVIAQRGGFSAVSHRSSARGRPTNLTLSVRLSNPDSDTGAANYYIDLRPRRGFDFEVAREWCDVTAVDGSQHMFERRTSKGATVWDKSIESIAPAIEPKALALPLIGGYRRFRSVFRFLSRMRTYRIEPAAVGAMQEPDGGAELRCDGGNAASVLRQIQRSSPEHRVRIRQLLESVVPGTVDVRPKRHGNKLTLEFTQDRGGAEPVKFEAFSMSDGTLRVLGLIMAVFQRPAPSVLVIEEPEASMHPGALGSILDILQLASQSMQVVVTTHSPDILDAKWIEDRHLRVLSWRHGSTRIDRVSQSVRAALGKHLMGAGELLRSNALTAEEAVDPA
ncbi:MAG: AAA family ATPase [Acidobacteria bacterium]|nr:AAA family ATPase [Acidobacteriota bacterium]